MKPLALALVLLLTPVSVFAASSLNFTSGSSVLIASSTPGNRYVLGGSVAVTAPVSGDLLAAGGSVNNEGQIAGDLFEAGGSITNGARVEGDTRIFGGRATLTGPMNGDLFAIVGSLNDLGGARSVYVAGANVTLSKGAKGPVTVYANNVMLDGVYADNVTVTAAGRLALASTTVIKGELTYQAPEPALIPEGAVISGGVHYTGTSYLPSSEETHAIALASFGIFLFIKILGALILAALVAGLFPGVAEMVCRYSFAGGARRALLSILLGFATLVATPILIVLLMVTFVGLGLAIILGLTYFLLIAFAFIYTAIILGALIARLFFKREGLRWSYAVLGMLVLFLISSLPLIGSPLVFVMMIYTLGLLVHLLYQFAFPRE